MSINNSIEFRVLGFKIEILSIIYGILLILWGFIVSLLSNSQSFTSYIPSILGLPILVFSYLSLKYENKKKTFYAHCSFIWINYFFRWFRFFEVII